MIKSNRYPHTDSEARRLLRCGAVAGFGPYGFGPDSQPGAILVDRGRVIAAGAAADIEAAYAGEWARVDDYPDLLILPGLVNAHCHLELTDVGPLPNPGTFVGWIGQLRRQTSEWDPDRFAMSARSGAAAARQAGTDSIGDIASFDGAAKIRREAGLGGCSFLELFGLGSPWDEVAKRRLGQAADGFEPHAPYSAGREIFRLASESDRPSACHLAETPEECRFIADGDGPFLELLRAMGKWSDEFAAGYGQGLSPVQWAEPFLRRKPWLLAHVNYATDADIAILADTGSSVAYCPIASEYFGHENHRYREMLEAGINVCLGTDSVVCQPPYAAQPMGMLQQIRHLHRRDATPASTLLKLATINGHRALIRQPKIARLAGVTFDPGSDLPPLDQVMRSAARCQPIELEPRFTGDS